MRKVIVIGCVAGSEVARRIANEHQGCEVLFYDTAEDIPLECRVNTDGLRKELRVFAISALPKFEQCFIPEPKHMPKGHERPYKYHR